MLFIEGSQVVAECRLACVCVVCSLNDVSSKEICFDETVRNFTMCPVCDELCGFAPLENSCFISKFTFLFDNPMTVVFSIAMSFWATMFLELWKRQQAVIQWQWDMEHYEEEEEVRPEFQARVKTTRVNPVTKKTEPYIPFYSKVSRYVAVNSIVLLMVLVMMAAVLSVMVYRMAISIVFHKLDDTIFQRNAKFVASISSAMLNLVVIVIFNFVYRKLVIFLTNIECPRTETEYEDSFTLKIFLFQFVNFYSSLIYIAFFKGKFFYHPGDENTRTSLLNRLRYDMCDPTGCLPELCIQLSVIMIGKQIFNNFIEIGWPVMQVWYNKTFGHANTDSEFYTRWEQDYDLAPYTRLSLFDEYLEMVIQYGFVTLFVAAFPLAPFFALLNNIFEIRLDAYKYLAKCRRPRPERVEDIGIWFNILRVITYFSVLTNALVISYTSDFIPRLVYMYGYSKDFTLKGYMDNALAVLPVLHCPVCPAVLPVLHCPVYPAVLPVLHYPVYPAVLPVLHCPVCPAVFDTSDYPEGLGPDPRQVPRDTWPSECRYRALRLPPDDPDKYEFKLQFWHVFTARLAFILIFEHVVFILTGLLAYLIPDIPAEVKVQMLREKKVEKETLFESEMRKVREERQEKNLQAPRTRSPSFEEEFSSVRSPSYSNTAATTPHGSPSSRRSSRPRRASVSHLAPF
ncbi:Anoctamin [Trinorchestia longiramus]|nr:Anoctamin [Trinorchestia longiramus]